MTRIWIDFNDIHDDVATTLLKFADGIVLEGAWVTCYDSEGTECLGFVKDLRTDGLVRLHIIPSTILRIPAESEH